MARILVVDDNQEIRHVLAYCLPELGHSVTLAEDGLVGLKLACGLSTDLILLDIDMPRMDGLKVCEILKRDAARRHIPVLMMTGRAGAEVLRRVQRAGAAAILSKPFTLEQLEAGLNRHLSAPAAAGS